MSVPVSLRIVEWDTLTEEVLVDGERVERRTVNGDERYSMFPDHDLRVVRMKLLHRPRSTSTETPHS